MTTIALHNSLETLEVQTPDISNGLNSTIRNISTSVIDILPLEDREQLLAKNNRFKILFTQFELEVNRISDEIDYRYRIENYRKRLFLSSDKIPLVFDKLLLRYPHLYKLYLELSDQLEKTDLWHIIKQKIFDEYLLDLIYEFLDFDMENEYNLSDFWTVSIIDLYSEYISNMNKFVEKYSWTKWIYIPKQNFKIIKPKILDEIFIYFKNLIFIDFWLPNLITLSDKQLLSIFRHLFNIKNINFIDTNFSILTKEKIKIIFTSLSSAKIIDFNGCMLGNLSWDMLWAIFSYLKNIKSINLFSNNLWNADSSTLFQMFSYLKNAKNFNLWSNSLHLLDNNSLEVIFSNISYARVIDLSLNNLWELDDSCLEMIFKYLKWVKSINLQFNEFSPEQELFIKTMLPNTRLSFIAKQWV